MSKDMFDHAAANADPNCPKCHGTGSYMYDHNHGTICNLCCKHDLGYWKLVKNYGENNGKWCCKAGCGHMIEEKDLSTYYGAPLRIVGQRPIGD